MVEKTKINIKCLDTSIDIVYDSSIFFLVVLFPVLAVTAKSATVITFPTHNTQAKAFA